VKEVRQALSDSRENLNTREEAERRRKRQRDRKVKKVVEPNVDVVARVRARPPFRPAP